MVSVGKRTQTLRISAFALMAKHEKELIGVVRRSAYSSDIQKKKWISCIDIECLETLIFGASPP